MMLVLLTAALPVLVACLLLLVPTAAGAARMAGATSLAVLLGLVLQRGLVGESRVALMVIAVLTAGALLGKSYGTLRHRGIAASLFLLAGHGLALAANDLRLVLLGWVGGPMASWWLSGLEPRPTAEGRRFRAMAGLYGAASTACLLTAVTLAARLAAAKGLPAFDVATWRELAHDDGFLAVDILAILAIAMRAGLVPFHSWVPVVACDAPVLTAVLFVCPLSSLALLDRLALTAASLGRGLHPVLAVAGLLTSLVASLLAIAERRFAKVVALVVMSQTGTAFVAMAVGSELAVRGAHAALAVVSLAGGALLLLSSQVEARFGVLERGTIAGIAQTLPRLATFAMVGTLALIGVPGSLGFVGSELMARGLFEEHPVLTLVASASSALASMAMMRSTFRIFFGTSFRVPKAIADGRFHELAALSWLLAVLLLGGIFPDVFMALGPRGPNVSAATLPLLE